MRVLVIDTETTGTDPETAGVVEYAHAVLDTETGRATGHRAWLTHPGPGLLPVPPEARAVHHIADEQVESAPHLDDVLGALDFSGVDAFCAHNAAFDRGFVSRCPTYWSGRVPTIPWVCTWRCARHLLPEVGGYGNQYLRYALGVEPLWPLTFQTEDQRRLSGDAWSPHRALYDVCTTAAILQRLLHEVSDRVIPALDGEAYTPVGYLVHLTQQPVLLRTCHFGKYRGVPWAEVPRDYLRWMVREGVQADDEDTAHTVRYYLER